MLHTKYKKLRNSGLSGFTVVELLVTLAIVVLVTGIIMIRYASFNSSVLLSSQAYITAFDIREAQSLAVSVRGNQSGYREEYGLYFDMNDPTQYILFQDDGDESAVLFDEGEQLGEPYKIDSRFLLRDICVTSGGSRECASDGLVSDLTISFKRPDFDAAFASTGHSYINSIEIVIGSADNEISRSVMVYASGQISVE